MVERSQPFLSLLLRTQLKVQPCLPDSNPHRQKKRHIQNLHAAKVDAGYGYGKHGMAVLCVLTWVCACMPMVDVGVAMSVAGAFGDVAVELEDTCTHIGN